MANPGDICVYCKRPHYRNDHGDYVDEGCSEFCATQDNDTKARLLDLKAGEFGIWPCSECGCAVEDEYEPGAICSKCVHPRAARVRGELLKEALPFLPPALKAKVLAELEGKKQPEPVQPPRYERTEPV